jgi:ribosomal-protein-alanine N-acetyltransferase
MVSELNREVGFNLGLFRERHLIAMSICWLIAPECHLLNLAVHPGLRRQGLGRQLLRAICLLAIKFGAKFFHLEVSVSNRPAQALYKSAGFRNVGYRPNYYPEGTDAILMTLDLLNIYGPQSGQQIS